MDYVEMIKKRTLLGKPKALTAFCSIFMLLCLVTEATAQSTFRTPVSKEIKESKNRKTAISKITFVPSKAGSKSNESQSISVSNPSHLSFVDETSQCFLINAGEKFSTTFTIEAGTTYDYKHGYVYINTNGDNEFTVKLDNPYISTLRDGGIRQKLRDHYQDIQGETNELYAFTCMGGYNSYSTSGWTEDEKSFGTWGYWDGTKMVVNDNVITYKNGASATSTANFGKNDVTVSGTSNTAPSSRWNNVFNTIGQRIAAPSVAGIYRMRYKLDCNNVDPNPDDIEIIYNRKNSNINNAIQLNSGATSGLTKFDQYVSTGGNAVDIMLYVLREYTLNIVLPKNSAGFTPNITIANSLETSYSKNGSVYVPTENLQYDDITTNNVGGRRPNIIIDNENHAITISYDFSSTPVNANAASPFWTDHTEQPALVDGYYQIEKPEHLAWFASHVGHYSDLINGKPVINSNNKTQINTYHPNANAILLADLDMSDYYFEPMGYFSFYSVKAETCNQLCYRGHFNGNNHKIKGLFISRLREWDKSTNYTTFSNRIPSYGNGLFACLGGGAVVENLFVESGYIANGTDYSGAIASSVFGTGEIIIRNVGSAADVVVSGWQAPKMCSGGFIGQTGANVSDDYTNLHITFENCFNMGSVNGGAQSSGSTAFLGKVTGGSVVEFKNCYSQLAVVTPNPAPKFFVDASANVTFSNCYINGNIESLPAGMTVVNNEFYSNGKLAYLLNTNGLCNIEAADDNINYYQKLSGEGVNPYPMCITSDPVNKTDQVFRFGVIMENGTDLDNEFAVNTTEYYNKTAGSYSLSDFKNNSAEYKNQSLRYSVNTETGDGLYGYGPLKFSRDGVITDANTLDKNDDVSLTYSEFKTLKRSSTNTYHISNQLEMRWLSWYVNNAESYTASKDVGVSIPNKVTAELTANIDMGKNEELGIVDDTEELFIPIGNSTSRPFAGSFDGRKHYLTNLKIDDNKTDNMSGVFGVVSPSDAYNTIVRITNFGIESGSVQGKGYAVGGIVGGIVEGAHAGTLLMDHCYNKAEVKASVTNSNAGGLVGMNGWNSVATVTIANSYNHGNITSLLADAHGSVGYSSPSATESTISNFYNVGSIVHGASNSSLNRNYPVLTNCYTLDGVDDYPFGKEVHSSFKSAEEFRNGSVAYYLNDDQQDIVFGQKLAGNTNIDEYPVLLSLAAETMYNEEHEKRVFPLQYYYPENGVYAYENVKVTTRDTYIPNGTYSFFNYFDKERVTENKLVTDLAKPADLYKYPANNFFDVDKIFYAADNAMLELEKKETEASDVLPGGVYYEATPTYVVMERKEGDILEDFRDVVKEATGVTPNKATSNYYEISDELQLRWFSYYVNYVYNYANGLLTADINLDSEHSFNPIGDGYTRCWLKTVAEEDRTESNTTTAKFRGAFNGNGFKISGLNIDFDEEHEVADQKKAGIGLFGQVATGADPEELSVLYKVNIAGGSVKAYTNKGVAGLLGYINGDTNNETRSYIVNCCNKANVQNLNAEGCVAGLVGQINYATNCNIINCYNQGTFTGSEQKGGITPYLESCNVTKETNGTTNYNNRQYVQKMYNCYTLNGDVVYYGNAFQTVKTDPEADSKGVKVYVHSVELAELENTYKYAETVADGEGRDAVEAGTTYYVASKHVFNNGTVAIWLNGGTTDIYTNGKFDASKAALRDVYGQALEYAPIDAYPEFKDNQNGLYAIIFTSPSDDAYEAWSFVPAKDYIKEYNKKHEGRYPNSILTCNNNLDANLSVNEETGLLEIKAEGKTIKYPNIAFVEPKFKNDNDQEEVRIFHGGLPVIDRKTNFAFVHPSYTVFSTQSGDCELSDSLDLHVYAKLVNDGAFGGNLSAHLANDIVLDNTITDDVLKGISGADEKSHLFQPIGNNTHPFTNTFDGRGFKITGLTDVKKSVASCGLFGETGVGAAIMNVGIEGEYTAPSNAKYAAGLVGIANGTIVSKCYSKVNVNNTKGAAAGIIAKADGTRVEYCYNHGNATASTNNGAIIAEGGDNVNNVYASYDISDAPMYKTGVASFTRCYALNENGTGVTSATQQQFNKGEVTFNLNAGIHSDYAAMTEPIYGQNVTIEEFDDYPVFFTGSMADNDYANCVYKTAYSAPSGAVVVPNWPVKASDNSYFTNTVVGEDGVATFNLTALINHEGNVPVVPYFKDKNIYSGQILNPTSSANLKAYYNEINAAPSLTKTMATVHDDVDNLDYYEIADSLELRWASYYQNKKQTTGNTFNFRLLNDIDLSVTTGGVTYNEVQWVPFGATVTANVESPGNGNDHYRGTIDGNNKTITNLFIDHTKEHDNSYIVGKARAGLVAQMNNGTIKNLVLRGSINNIWQTGGLIGRAIGSITIKNCGVEMDITNSSNTGAGGLMGYAVSKVLVDNCYSKSDIHGNYLWHYALIGNNRSKQETTITNCYSAGTTEGKFQNHNNHLVGNTDNTLIAQFVNCYILETEDDKATINTPSEIHYETLENFNNGKVCYLLNVGGYGRNMTAADVANLKFRQTLGGDAAYDADVTEEQVDEFPALAGTRCERADVHKAGLFKPEVEPVTNNGTVVYDGGVDFAYSLDEKLDKGWYFNGTRSLTQITETGHYDDCVPEYSVPFFYLNRIYTGDNLNCHINKDTKDVMFTSSSVETVEPVNGTYEIGDKLHLFWFSYYTNKGVWLYKGKMTPDMFYINGKPAQDVEKNTYGPYYTTNVKLVDNIDLNPGFAFSSKGYHYKLDENGHAVDSIAPVFKTDAELIEYYNKSNVPYYGSDEFMEAWAKYMSYSAYKVVDNSQLRGGMITAQNLEPIGKSTSQERNGSSWYYKVKSTNAYKGDFNGNNHYIKNLYVTTSTSVAGLIGVGAGGTKIHNLGIESGYVHSSNSYAGVFAGVKYYGPADAGQFVIRNCYNKAFCMSEDVNCGAFVSASHSGAGPIQIFNCINYADIYTICDPGAFCSNIAGGANSSTGAKIYNNINFGRLMSRSGLQELKHVGNTMSIDDAALKPFFVKAMGKAGSESVDYYYRTSNINYRQNLIARYADGQPHGMDYAEFGVDGGNNGDFKNNIYVEYVGDYNNMYGNFREDFHSPRYNFSAKEVTDDQRKFQSGEIAYNANLYYSGDDTNNYKADANKILYVQCMNDIKDKEKPGDLYPVLLDFSDINNLVYKGMLFDSSADNFDPSKYEPEDFYMNYTGANRHPHSGYHTGNAVSTKLGSGNDNWIVFFNHDNDAYNPHSDNTVMNGGRKDNYGVNCVWGKLAKGSDGSYAPISGTTIQADEILLSDPGSKIYTSEYNSTSQKTLYREDMRKQHKDFNFYVPCPVPAKKISYKRTIKNVKDYATISTPYKVYGVVVNNQDVLGSDIKFYKFKSYKTENSRTTVTFEEVSLKKESVDGNEYNVLPVGSYLMKYTPSETVGEGGSAVLSFRSKTDLYSDLSAVQVKDYETVSSVEQTDRVPGEVNGSYAQGLFRQKYFDNDILPVGESTDYVAYQGGYLVRMDNKSFIDPFRMYMYMPKQATSSDAKVRIQFTSLFGDDEVVTDVIDAVMTEDGNIEEDVPVDVFDLNGRKLKHQIMRSEALDGLDAGVYIINGNKVYKKN